MILDILKDRKDELEIYIREYKNMINQQKQKKQSYVSYINVIENKINEYEYKKGIIESELEEINQYMEKIMKGE